jgi:hypothetical protein
MNPPRHIPKKWLSPAFRLVGFILCVWLEAGTLLAASSSANYSIPGEVLNAGGGHSASPSYSNDGSIGGIVGIAASPTQTLGAGFLAQIEGLSPSLPPKFSILDQPVDVKIIKGSSAFLTVSTTPNESDAVQTLYSLVGTTVDGVSGPIGTGGMVPSSGILSLPLQALTDSTLSYAVQFSRSYADGSTSTAQTRSFTVALRAWTEAAGTYTTLLHDGNSSVTLGDGAFARGLLTATVSRTGSVSGRVVYVEAPALSGAPSPGVRVYMPATRTFTGRLLPSSADPSKLVCSVRLGTGTQANRQTLDLKVDFLASQPTLNATVTDTISAKPEVCVSLAELCVPASGAVPPEVVGRYVLSANSAAGNNAYTLVQVLASGRILWTTRLTGYTGSGSGGLVAENSSKLTAPFFESRLLVGGTLLNSKVLLGGLNWTRLVDSSWNAAFSLGDVFDHIEKQSSYLSGSKVGSVFNPVYSDAFPSTGVEFINFSEQNYCPWNNTALATLFPASTACLLTVKDPLSDPAAAGFSWQVTVSSTGSVKTTGVPLAGVSPPTLVLRLNRSRGEWSGSYTVERVRRTLVGAALYVEMLRGSGWVETGAQMAPSTARWELSPQKEKG